jgi:uncharacterized protein (DUF488 family)
VALLRSAGVQAIADVRSRPYSPRSPWYGREDLSKLLKSAGIAYVFLGDTLGARPEDPASYRAGSLDFGLRAATAQYASGISRLIQGSQRMRIGVMCAEKDPCTCHRSALVSRTLCEAGRMTGHLLHDGRILTQDDVLEECGRRFGIAPSDMFRSDEDRRRDIYAEWARRIAWTDPET